MNRSRKKNRQDADPKQLATLLARIEHGATDETITVANLLRECLRLGFMFDSAELSEWARSEVNGYSPTTPVPDYRTLPTSMIGNFSGPFGSGIKNAPLPSWIFTSDELPSFQSVELRQPVAEIYELAHGGNAEVPTLQIPFPGDVIAVLQQRDSIYQGMVISSGWQLLSSSAVKGVIDIIRTRALDFALQLGDELPEVDSAAATTLPTTETVSQIFHTTVFGGSNVALGNTGIVEQRLAVIPGNLESLRQALSDLGLPLEHVRDLEAALVADRESSEQPGPAVQSWIGRTMTKIGTGALSVSNSAAGSLIAGAVLKFLGIG